MRKLCIKCEKNPRLSRKALWCNECRWIALSQPKFPGSLTRKQRREWARATNRSMRNAASEEMKQQGWT